MKATVIPDIPCYGGKDSAYNPLTQQYEAMLLHSTEFVEGFDDSDGNLYRLIAEDLPHHTKLSINYWYNILPRIFPA